MIKTTTIKWAVDRSMVRGSLVGTYPTREEAQAVADSQDLPHVVTKWTVNEFWNETGCGWCDEENIPRDRGYRAPRGSALCDTHNRIRMETL